MWERKVGVQESRSSTPAGRQRNQSKWDRIRTFIFTDSRRSSKARASEEIEIFASASWIDKHCFILGPTPEHIFKEQTTRHSRPQWLVRPTPSWTTSQTNRSIFRDVFIRCVEYVLAPGRCSAKLPPKVSEIVQSMLRSFPCTAA